MHLLCSLVLICLTASAHCMLREADYEASIFGTAYRQNVVLLAAQKSRDCSRTCIGYKLTPKTILTTATCVEKAVSVIVQEYVTTPEEYNKLFSIMVPYYMIKLCDKYDPVSKVNNIALISLPKELKVRGYGVGIGSNPESSPTYQIKNGIRNKLYVIGSGFSKYDWNFPSTGINVFELTFEDWCLMTMKYEKTDPLYGDPEFSMGEPCIVSKDLLNTLCREDEGAPIFELISSKMTLTDVYAYKNDDPKEVTMYSYYVLYGLVNTMNRDCSTYSYDHKQFKVNPFSQIVSVVEHTKWIYNNMVY